MIGCGRANVAQIADLARANVADSVPSKALEAFASLGAGGKFPGNQGKRLAPLGQQAVWCVAVAILCRNRAERTMD